MGRIDLRLYELLIQFNKLVFSLTKPIIRIINLSLDYSIHLFEMFDITSSRAPNDACNISEFLLFLLNVNLDSLVVPS